VRSRLNIFKNAKKYILYFNYVHLEKNELKSCGFKLKENLKKKPTHPAEKSKIFLRISVNERMTFCKGNTFIRGTQKFGKIPKIKFLALPKNHATSHL